MTFYAKYFEKNTTSVVTLFKYYVYTAINIIVTNKLDGLILPHICDAHSP